MSDKKRNMSFSERMGIIEPKTVIQLECMNSELQTAIYNFFYSLLDSYWNTDLQPNLCNASPMSIGIELATEIWTDYFHEPVDEMSSIPHWFLGDFKKHFFNLQWYEVYDIAEFFVQKLRSLVDESFAKGVERELNEIFSNELSGYRFVNGFIVPVSASCEIESLEYTLALEDRFSGAREHISAGLKLLSSRGKNGYRNVVKEAISGVESAARVICGKESATLGDALKLVEKQHQFHPALKDAWLKLYGYTNDADGIRHALSSDDEAVTLSFAQYVLISCSAFINYLAALESEGK